MREKQVPNDAKPSGLDLGLSALLKVAEAPADAAAPSPAPAAAQVETKPAAPAVPLNEYESCAAHEDWQGLLKICEGKLSHSDIDHVEPRLWWIKAHLKTGGMPVTFLTAPLEAAVREVSPASPSALKSLAAESLAAAGAAVEKAGDGQLAVSLLQKSVALDSSRAPMLAGTVEREIKRLQSQTGLSSKQIAERDEQLRKLLPLRSPTLEAASIAEAPPYAMKMKVAKPKKTSKPSARRRPAVYGAVAVLLLLLVLAYFKRDALVFAAAKNGEPALDQHGAARSPELKLAALSRIDNVSAFDGLYYDLKNHVDAPVRKGAVVRHEGPVADVSQAQPEAPAPAPQKQPLSMRGPSEPREVQDAVRHPAQPHDDSASILFGGDQASRPDTSASAGMGGGGHQQFTGHRVFRVLARTRILAQPSYRTEVLGMLNPGERVAAEGRVEGWLQIRSTSGRVGFIFAQDAEPDA